jgi:hypothetical protein
MWWFGSSGERPPHPKSFSEGEGFEARFFGEGLGEDSFLRNKKNVFSLERLSFFYF